MTTGKTFRYSAIVLCLLLLTLAIIPFFISLDSYRQQLESRLTAAVGEPVTISKFRIHLLPLPSLKISGIVLGDAQSQETITVNHFNGRLSVAALLDNRIVIPGIWMTDINASIPIIERLYQALGKIQADQVSDTHQRIHIQQVYLEDVLLTTKSKRTLGPYRMELYLDRHGDIASIIAQRLDNALIVHAAAVEDHMFVSLEAREWTLPLGKPIHFKSLKTEGEWQGHTLHLTSFSSRGYGGTIEGKATISWEHGWKIETPFTAQGIELEPLLTVMNTRSISGVLNSSCKLRVEADTPSQLWQQPCMLCNFGIDHGVIYKTDLEQASRLTGTPTEEATGQTPFERLEGKIDINQGAIHLTRLHVRSPTLKANGEVKISPEKVLDGEIEVSVNKTAGIVSVPLRVSGTTDSPHLKPTRSALAGGAVGTAILGPGLGTAIGIKAGNALRKIGRLFSGDENKDEPER